MQHIVNKYYTLILDSERYVRIRGYVDVAGLHIIPVKGDVELAVVDAIVACYFLNHLGNTVRQIYAPGLYADNCGILEVKVIFYQLVGQPLQRYIQLIFIEQGLHKQWI